MSTSSSEAVDMPYPSRQSLINQYRRRIQSGDRTKLTKDERIELAQSFVALLSQCQSEEEAIRLCQAEISLLEEGYPITSVATRYLPEWRKVIAEAVDRGQLPKQDLQPKLHGRKSARYDHWGLKYLLYPPDTYQALRQAATQRNNVKQYELKPIRVGRFLQASRTLLAGTSPLEWAAGLIAVTGRRFSEITAKGKFQPTHHPYAIAFSGQLKKATAVEDVAFTIATLIDASEVLATLERFRAHPRIQDLHPLPPSEINSRLNSSVNYHVRATFEKSEIVPRLVGEQSVSVHNLRGCYGAIAVHFFCPPQQTVHRFIAEHLGHLIGEARLREPTPGATEHYFHYYLTNSQHQPIQERGILLEQFGPLPQLSTNPVDPIMSPQDQEDKPMGGTSRKRTSLRTYADLMPRWETLFDHLCPDGNNQQDRMTALLEWAEKQIQPTTPAPLETPSTASTIHHQAKTLAWLTDEVNTLRQTIRSLQSEYEHAMARLEELQQTNTSTSLEAENQRLIQERDAAIAKLNQFRDLLNGSPTPPLSSSPTTAETLPNQGEHSHSTPEQSSTPDTETHPSLQQSQPRIRDDQQALQNIHYAIDQILAWNNHPNTSWENKWVISVSSIQALLRGHGFSASQHRVQQALKQRQDDIQHHHQAHQLSQRHNARHKHSISDVIPLSS